MTMQARIRGSRGRLSTTETISDLKASSPRPVGARDYEEAAAPEFSNGERSPDDATKVPRTRVQGFTTILLHNRLSVRFTALFALAAAGFLIGQTVAYLWLPEGLLRGASIGAAVATDQAASGFTIEWARIVAWNLPIMGLFFVAPNLIRFVSGIPFGYVPAITMTAYFGIITGTNSFTMAAEVGKIAPSLEWVTNPGFYEIFAYVLAAAATYEITRWQIIKTDGKESTVRFFPQHGGWRNRQMWFGLLLAVGVLLGADAWEAQLILQL